MVSQRAIEDALRAAGGKPMDVRGICECLGIPYNDATRTTTFHGASKLVKYGIADRMESGRIVFFTIRITGEDKCAANHDGNEEARA